MTCPVCGVKASGKTGYCLEHWRTHGMPARVASDPAINAKRSASMRKFYMENPERKTESRQWLRDMAKMPSVKAKKARAAKERRVWERGWKAITLESRAKAGQSLSATKLAWCPDYLRDEYRMITRGKGIRAADAKAMILEQHQRIMAKKFAGATDAR